MAAREVGIGFGVLLISMEAGEVDVCTIGRCFTCWNVHSSRILNGHSTWKFGYTVSLLRHGHLSSGCLPAKSRAVSSAYHMVSCILSSIGVILKRKNIEETRGKTLFYSSTFFHLIFGLNSSHYRSSSIALYRAVKCFHLSFKPTYCTAKLNCMKRFSLSLTSLSAEFELQLHISFCLDHPKFVKLIGTLRPFHRLPTKQVRMDPVSQYAHDNPRFFEHYAAFLRHVQ